MSNLLLVDASYFIHRAYFSNKYGEDDVDFDRAIKDYVWWIDYLKEQTQATHAAIVLDVHSHQSSNFELLDDYKANRTKHDDLNFRWGDFVEAGAEKTLTFGVEGNEADDTIASITNKMQYEADQIYIASSDKDMMQLVNDEMRTQVIRVDNHRNLQFYDEINVCNKYGIDNPRQLVEWLALVGDGADGYKGVYLVGGKKASTLIQTYGDLIGIYKAVDDHRIGGKLAEHLIAGVQDAITGYKLAKLNDGLVIPYHDLIDYQI